MSSQNRRRHGSGATTRRRTAKSDSSDSKQTNISEQVKLDVGDIRQQVRELKDKLGKPVDPGVIEAVTALNSLGFRTTASCEGHGREQWHERYQPSLTPWVAIDFETADASRDLIRFLEAFYSKRPAPSHHALLIVAPMSGEKLSGHLVNAGGDLLKKWPSDGDDEIIALCKTEWDEFTGFCMDALRQIGARGVDARG